MIDLDRVTKIYPGSTTPAVDGITLQVPEGEICVFIGPSGCGKTTLMRMINRLAPITSGSIKVGGTNIMELDPIELRRSIGYVIQQIGLFPHMTVYENIAVVPKAPSLAKAENRRPGGRASDHRRPRPRHLSRALPSRTERRPGPAGGSRPSHGCRSAGDAHG